MQELQCDLPVSLKSARRAQSKATSALRVDILARHDDDCKIRK